MASENVESKIEAKKPYILIFHGFSIFLRTNEQIIEARRLIHQLSESITSFDGTTLSFTVTGREILNGMTVQSFPRNGWEGPSSGLYLTIMKVENDSWLFISSHIKSTEDDEDSLIHMNDEDDPSQDEIQRFYEMVFSNSPDNKIFHSFKKDSNSRRYRRTIVIVQ